MPRIIKHPDLRRQELLDCAQAMFLERGYENASLNDVIAQAGSSKGAFYHYFPSKEALLEALAGRFAQQALAQVQDVLDDPGLDALPPSTLSWRGRGGRKLRPPIRAGLFSQPYIGRRTSYCFIGSMPQREPCSRRSL